MEVHLPQQQEAELNALAAQTGRGTDELVQEAVAALVELVVIKDKRVVRIDPVAAARPFFRAEAVEEGALFWRPRTDSNRRRQP